MLNWLYSFTWIFFPSSPCFDLQYPWYISICFWDRKLVSVHSFYFSSLLIFFSPQQLLYPCTQPDTWSRNLKQKQQEISGVWICTYIQTCTNKYMCVHICELCSIYLIQKPYKYGMCMYIMMHNWKDNCMFLIGFIWSFW